MIRRAYIEQNAPGLKDPGDVTSRAFPLPEWMTAPEEEERLADVDAAAIGEQNNERGLNLVSSFFAGCCFRPSDTHTLELCIIYLFWKLAVDE
ncbi:hypothetical protein HPP92_020942 [Vanilla planifolia]|uniref:Uncharacterized protein n=1 Tax=Vanilla planifolia TaxID=51239 RepID=A0A835Q0R6_VANPL|nr:hypothetical protein HPP92_021261 [Vanilla planifolia]KAG0462466.1 hypothetical protein HPP92_020942 [Vanilla planifolia]